MVGDTQRADSEPLEVESGVNTVEIRVQDHAHRMHQHDKRPLPLYHESTPAVDKVTLSALIVRRRWILVLTPLALHHKA